MYQELNCRGFDCPIPVVMSKQALAELQPSDILAVTVDGQIQVENIKRMAVNHDHGVDYKELPEGGFLVEITVSAPKDQICPATLPGGDTIVVFASDEMGSGDRKLGLTLMKGFIYALTQQDELPQTLVFYNSGVHLCCEGSEALKDLKALAEAGVAIVSCGLCLNYYELGDKLAVGQVSNMYAILELQLKAGRIIRP